MSHAPAAAVTNPDLRPYANAIRALAMDAVEKAKAGHPGMPMGMADIATLLYSEFLSFDAAQPRWPNRDRVVLSNGHGSMLLYAALHLLGDKDFTLAQLQNFRQLGSLTAGHPEYGHGQAIETTTGPLGQGLGNAVGMALAERLLATRYGDDLINHRTYVLLGDGCLMEGISHEALALAGHWRLNKLIALFDDNSISIDGATSLADSSDVTKRVEASGWRVLTADGHDYASLRAALQQAQHSDKPTLIRCRTIIGYGAGEKAGKAASHGAPLGAAELATARHNLHWPHPPFVVPADIKAWWEAVGSRGASARLAWENKLAQSPQREALTRALAGELGDIRAVVSALTQQLQNDQPIIATRKASQLVLEKLVPAVPALMGGSADLTESNLTHVKGMTAVSADNFSGRYIHYGVREHGMAAVMNGLALYGGVVPYGGTFLVFSDYARPSMRLAALMGLRVIYVLTHDSIGLGSDGPTHQPVEHLSSLRAMPNMLVWRPCDAVETAEAWEGALQHAKTPSVLALSRQALPFVNTSPRHENLSLRGAYVLREPPTTPQVVLLASGSEVAIALEAQALLATQAIAATVVSCPCLELFRQQSHAYRQQVLGGGVFRVALEAGVRQSWDCWLRDKDIFIGMASYGASGSDADLYQHFGITAAAVVAQVKAAL